jgi:hypothetical protein
MMGNTVTVQCRSYSALAFDGCPACVGAALEAVGQAGIYVLGRTAPDLVDQEGGPLDMTYRLKVRLYDDVGDELANDELSAEQTIEAVGPDELPLDEDSDLGDPEDDGTGWYDHGTSSSMRLDDFQTILDRLDLAAAGRHSLTGFIAGRLFGYERSIGAFEIEIAPAA